MLLGGLIQRFREEWRGGMIPDEKARCKLAYQVDACDKPCVLEDWNEWSTCTKATAGRTAADQWTHSEATERSVVQ